jgi:cell division protein DivIC
VSKGTKRRLFVITLTTILLLSFFSFNIWQMATQIMEKNAEAKFLQDEKARLEDEEAYLRVEVEKLNDPEYIARYAREKYLYSKDNEIIFKIP